MQKTPESTPTSRTVKTLRALAILGLAASVSMCAGCKSKTNRPPIINGSGDGSMPIPGAAVIDDAVGLNQKMPPHAGGTFTPVGENNGHWQDVIYFAFDRSEIGDAEKPKLEALAKYLKDNPTYCVQIEGNCDARGAEEHNRGLSERRALAAFQYLVLLGIADTRFETIGYGVERPAVPNAKTEAEYAKNRRDEFVIGLRQ